MEKTDIHKQVSRDYVRMLEAAEAHSACCAPPSGAGTVAAVAGYAPETRELEAAGQSFGCGNPLAFAAVTAGQTVLDLGCGAGLDLLLAAEKVGPSGAVIGIDMTQEMVDRARTHVAAAGLDNVEVRLGMIEQMPVASTSVDWVISNCVINLSPEKARVFSEIARVLKPGGRFSISDIVVEDLPEALRENATLYSACVAGAISEAAYLDGLRAAGLDELDVVERQVYAESQLVSLITSEIPGLELSAELIAHIAPQVVGKVWSAKFTGTRAP
ncbi:MAG: arsenite methyltransferase [Halioglobus sp.]|nr:arsenite methyltransferase [Halioglobus sp.]